MSIEQPAVDVKGGGSRKFQINVNPPFH